MTGEEIMEKNTARLKTAPSPKLPIKQIIDPLMLKAYAEASEHMNRWQAGIDHLIREVLGLKGDQPLDPATVLSADEIRKEMNRYIPEDQKFCDLIVDMRQE